MPVPNTLALEVINDGAQIQAAPHRNNNAAVQAALNAIIGFLDGEGTGAVFWYDGTSWKGSAAPVAAGQALIWSGSAWAPGTAGVAVISDQTLSGAAATITFSSIPATYKELRVILQGRGDTAASAVNVSLRFNADTGANYDRQFFQGNVSAASAGESFAQTSAQVGTLSAATSPANAAGQIAIEIPNYTGAVFQKTAEARTGFKSSTASGGLLMQDSSIFWRNTAAITQIDLIASAGNFIIGTRATLYGIG